MFLSITEPKLWETCTMFELLGNLKEYKLAAQLVQDWM